MYSPGEKVIGMRYPGTVTGTVKGEEVKATVIKCYKHHVLTRVEEGWLESFRYFDIKGANNG